MWANVKDAPVGPQRSSQNSLEHVGAAWAISGLELEQKEALHLQLRCLIVASMKKHSSVYRTWFGTDLRSKIEDHTQ